MAFPNCNLKQRGVFPAIQLVECQWAEIVFDNKRFRHTMPSGYAQIEFQDALDVRSVFK